MSLRTLVMRRSERVRLYYGVLVLLVFGAGAYFMANSSECTLCDVYNLHMRSPGTYDCTLMDFDPETLICLHDIRMDKLSHEVWHTGLWEAQVVRRFQTWLRDDPSLAVIDLGANVGVYTLIAASMGHRVLAVEPNLENVRRLARTTILGNLQDKVTLLRNALGDVRGTAEVISPARDVGQSEVQPVGVTGNGSSKRIPPAKQDEADRVNVIQMDDLIHFCYFKKAVLKLDISGAEALAFQHARRLFSHIIIPFVVFDWRNVRPLHNKVSDRHMVTKLVSFLRDRGYVPKDHNNIMLAHPVHWNTWPDFVIFELDERLM